MPDFIGRQAYFVAMKGAIMRRWSRRRFFYLAMGVVLLGLAIAILGTMVKSDFLTALGVGITFYLSPVFGLLWIIRVFMKD